MNHKKNSTFTRTIYNRKLYFSYKSLQLLQYHVSILTRKRIYDFKLHRAFYFSQDNFLIHQFSSSLAQTSHKHSAYIWRINYYQPKRIQGDFMLHAMLAKFILYSHYMMVWCHANRRIWNLPHQFSSNSKYFWFIYS